MLGLDRATAMDPIDEIGCSSNTGFQLAPPSALFPPPPRRGPGADARPPRTPPPRGRTDQPVFQCFEFLRRVCGGESRCRLFLRTDAGDDEQAHEDWNKESAHRGVVLKR